MPDPDVLQGATPGTSPTPPSDEEPTKLLTRLNMRGFRLVMVADALVLYAVAVASMWLRFGTTWPTYPVPLYLASFAVAAIAPSSPWLTQIRISAPCRASSRNRCLTLRSSSD